MTMHPDEDDEGGTEPAPTSEEGAVERSPSAVTPAQAGVQSAPESRRILDSRLRGNDDATPFSTASEGEEGGTGKHPSLPAVLFFAALGVGVCALTYLAEVEPSSADPRMTTLQSDALRGVVAGVAALGLVLVVVLRRYRPALLAGRLRVVLKVAAALLVVVGSLAYFYVPRGVARGEYLNFHDLYHYFVGLKYYREVSYEQLYACHLEADRARPRPRYRDGDGVRDLLTYELRRAKEIRLGADCSTFTPERWREFGHDTSYFDGHMPRSTLLDQGYNGTPFHALVAGSLVESAEVDRRNLVLATFVDVLGLCALFAVLAWAFGWEVAFLVALFVFANLADFYFHVSYFRYWWLVTLGVGLACLQKRRYGLAAVFLVVSAMLNVFPLLFAAGIGLKILVSLVKERRLARHYKTFVAWAAAATVLCGAATMLHDRPIERYGTFFEKMQFHSRMLTPKRIGFRYNFLYRGAVTGDGPDTSFARRVAEQRPYQVPYAALVVVILLLGAAVVVRLDDVQATVLSGFLLFFMIFSTVAYYYACAALLVLLWAGELRRARGALLTALLFGLMAVVHVIWSATQARAFLNNTVLSAMFTIYLGVVLACFAHQTGRLGWLRDRARALAKR